MGKISKSYLKELAEKKKYKSGGFSTEGYKRNSPDVNNPYNVIPSNQITMEGVDFPVMGIDDLGHQQMMYPGNNYTFPGNYVTEFPLKNMGNKRYQIGGTKDSDYMNFVRTLPPNLAQPNDPSYNLRGFWESLGNPESFDYNQPTDPQGYYHAFSRNPRTGQILKAPFHPTFKMAIEEDRKAGYFPIVTPDNKIKTVSSSEYNNKTPTYDFLNKPNYEGYFQMGGTMSVPGVNGQVVSSGPQPLTSVKKTRGPITKTKKGNVKTMPTKAVKKILKNLK